MDSWAILRTDMGFFVGSILWADEWSHCIPKGPDTAHFRTPVPSTIPGTCFATRVFNGQYMDLLGILG